MQATSSTGGAGKEVGEEKSVAPLAGTECVLANMQPSKHASKEQPRDNKHRESVCGAGGGGGGALLKALALP